MEVDTTSSVGSWGEVAPRDRLTTQPIRVVKDTTLLTTMSSVLTTTTVNVFGDVLGSSSDPGHGLLLISGTTSLRRELTIKGQSTYVPTENVESFSSIDEQHLGHDGPTGSPMKDHPLYHG